MNVVPKMVTSYFTVNRLHLNCPLEKRLFGKYVRRPNKVERLTQNALCKLGKLGDKVPGRLRAAARDTRPE